MILMIGAGIGSVVTYKIVKKKYDSIIQEEIESVKMAFSKSAHDEPDNNTDTAVGISEDKNTLEDIIDNNGYSKMSDKNEKEDTSMNKPYIISPEEFGECDYGIITLNYYTDGVLTNEKGQIIDNLSELVGENFASHFGDYENDPDTVYVRNDDHKTDYEILKDYEAYYSEEE